MQALALLILLLLASLPAAAKPGYGLCNQYRPALTREAQAEFGLHAPVPMLAAQLFQESGCRAHVTAWDDGRGLAQFMDGTAQQIVRIRPDLGPADPYNPIWAMRAQVAFDAWLYRRVQGVTQCDKWGAALKSYNAGLGYVQRAQRRSPAPGAWFGLTENINAGQSVKNFVHSRDYPRRIIFLHQTKFKEWGSVQCKDFQQ